MALWKKRCTFLLQGKLVPKLALGAFLTLSARNGPNLQSYLFQAYISLNPSRVKQYYTILYKEQLKLFLELRNFNFKLVKRCESLKFIFEHISILKQLPHFSSCRVFETYSGFETITRIHIKLIFKYLRTLTSQNQNMFQRRDMS